MTILNSAKTLLFVSLAVLFGFTSYLAWTTAQAEKQTEVKLYADLDTLGSDLDSVKTDLNTLGGSLNKFGQVLDTVNRPCGGGQPCGTLADVAKTLNTIRGTAGQVEIAAAHENKNLTTLDQQEATLFSDVHGTITGANTLLATTNLGMQTEFPNLEKTTTDFDSFIQSQDFTSTVHNANVITANLGQTTGDFQKKFHDVLYPPPCTNWKCHLKEDWGIIRGGLELLEPAYYGSQLLH